MRMPLVWELTNELKDFMTPTKLRAINAERAEGSLPEEVCQFYDRLHGDPNLHYEQIIHEVQTAKIRDRSRKNPYHTLALQLTRLVNLILYLKHKNNAAVIAHAARWYQGLKSIADIARPLWVFSLNHDICTELICDAHNIAWSNGVPDEPIEFLQTNRPGSVRLAFNRIPREAFNENHGFGSDGVNLLKLHGAIDLFIANEKQDILYVPRGDRIGILERIYELSGYLGRDGEKIVPLGELALADLEGEMQFLQPTLLTGHKFEAGFQQHAPPEFLDVFTRKIESFNEFVAIGYSFGDDHINRIVTAWLARGESRKVFVVDPGGRAPKCLAHASNQVTLLPQKAVDFLAEQGGYSLSSADRYLRTVYGELRDSKKYTEERVHQLIDPTARMKRLAQRLVALVRSGVLKEGISDTEIRKIAENVENELMHEAEQDFLAKIKAT